MNHFYACAIKSLEAHQSYTSAAVKMEGTLVAGLQSMLIYYKKRSTQKLSRVYGEWLACRERFDVRRKDRLRSLGAKLRKVLRQKLT